MSIRQEVFDFQEMIKKSRGDQFRTGSGAAAGFLGFAFRETSIRYMQAMN